jgi:hypothetical protein
MQPAKDILPDDDAPSGSSPSTVMPPAPASVIRYKSGAPVDELLYRMAMGDVGAAIDAAQDLIDAGYVPVLVMVPMGAWDLRLGYREEVLLSVIDGCATLAEVIERSGLELLDALRALCELLEMDAITLC